MIYIVVNNNDNSDDGNVGSIDGQNNNRSKEFWLLGAYRWKKN